MADISDQRTLEAIARGVVEELTRHTDLEWVIDYIDMPDMWRICDTPHILFTIWMDYTDIAVYARDRDRVFVYEDPNLVDDLVDYLKNTALLFRS